MATTRSEKSSSRMGAELSQAIVDAEGALRLARVTLAEPEVAARYAGMAARDLRRALARLG